MLIERCVQKVIGTYEEAVALEKKFDALEEKLGNVPKKRRYFPRFAGYPMYTLIWEREWPSLAAIEALKIDFSDPEWAEAFSQAAKVFADSQFELFEEFTLPE